MTLTTQNGGRRWSPDECIEIDEPIESTSAWLPTEESSRAQASAQRQYGQVVFVSFADDASAAYTEWTQHAAKIFAQRWRARAASYAFRVLLEQPFDRYEAVATALGQPDIASVGDEGKLWRGVFVVPSERQVIFEDAIEFRDGQLPEWKPRITIDRRTMGLLNDA